MEISAGTVKQLREKTGVGMMQCKSALIEAQGDLGEAEKILRKKGLAAAAGKAGRATGEGTIAAQVASDSRSGVLVEVNCETDFAARNADFQELVSQVVALAADKGVETKGSSPDPAAVEALAGAGVSNLLAAAVAKIGENMQLRRFVKFVAGEQGGIVGSYIHTGGKIGVLLEASIPSGKTGGAEALLRDVSMHIAAAAPRFVRREDVSEEVLAYEREIARDQALKAGKPAQVVEKIVQGRIEKYFSEICLLEQPFVKDPDKTVRQVLGEGLTIRRFARFVLGDGA
ncbi:MAG TPA: translation elongation factor Ts [Candidatus Polarisedimenticolaceae bacterium]|nr:translation elongation factor Ts [Candidatus Polarisedimenticolaceae bacterium]